MSPSTGAPLRSAALELAKAAEWPLLVALALLVLMYPVNADRDGDDEGVILAWPDLHPVGVPDAEPLPGDPPHQSTVAGELPVLVREVSCRLKPRPVGERDLIAVPDGREERGADRGDDPVAVFDVHRVAQREQLFADDRADGARGILELEGLAEAQRLAVDEEDPVPVLVLDPEICREGKDAFLNEISHEQRL